MRDRSLLIRGGTLVEPGASVRTADILVRDGRIALIGPHLDAPGAEILTAVGKIVLPGLISAHTHITTLLDRGLTDNQPLELWRFGTIYGGFVPTDRDLYITAALGAAELLLGGCTAVFDHVPVNPARLAEGVRATAEACADIGLRAVIAPLYSDVKYSEGLPLHLIPEARGAESLDIFSVVPTDLILENARRFLREWKGRHPLVEVALGPSGPERCTDELLQGTAELAAEFDVPIQTHLCVTKAQVIQGYHLYGCSIVAHLERLGLLGPRLSLAHAVWISADDIERLARTGTLVVHNPLSNMRLGDGIAPIQRMRDAGVTVALGADGPGSGDSLDMFEVVKLTALLHKLYGRPSGWVSAEQALRFCLHGGAAVMRQELGRIGEGAAADLVILDGAPYFRMAVDGYMLRQLVYCQPARTLETVLVAGRVVVESGRLLTMDLQDLRREAQGIVDRIEAQLPQRLTRQMAAEPLLDELLRRVAQIKLPFSRSIPTDDDG